MNTTHERMLKGEPDFMAWIKEVKACYGLEADFNQDCEVYSYASAYENHATPQKAYEDCQMWLYDELLK